MVRGGTPGAREGVWGPGDLDGRSLEVLSRIAPPWRGGSRGPGRVARPRRGSPFLWRAPRGFVSRHPLPWWRPRRWVGGDVPAFFSAGRLFSLLPSSLRLVRCRAGFWAPLTSVRALSRSPLGSSTASTAPPGIVSFNRSLSGAVRRVGGAHLAQHTSLDRRGRSSVDLSPPRARSASLGKCHSRRACNCRPPRKYPVRKNPNRSISNRSSFPYRVK